MKKLIIFIAALSLCSCVDYGCSTSYVVENRTSGNVVVSWSSVSVKSGEKKTVEISSMMCGKKHIPQDYYNGNYEYYVGTDRPVFTVWITIDGVSPYLYIPVLRKYLTYSHEKYYYDTYTLVLTDEILADLLADAEAYFNELDQEAE